MHYPLGTYAKAIVAFFAPGATVIAGAATAALVPGADPVNWSLVLILAGATSVVSAGGVYAIRNRTSLDYETDGGPDADYATDPDEPYDLTDGDVRYGTTNLERDKLDDEGRA